MAKTDQGSIAQAMRIFNTAARQAGVRFIDGELVPFTEELTGLVDAGLGATATAIGISDDDVSGATQKGASTFQELREKVLAPLITQPGLPQITPVQTPQTPTNPLSQDRLDFAEQVAGRPVL